MSSAKECVTTHLPKQLALKMDGAQASCLYSAVTAIRAGMKQWPAHEGVTSRRVAAVCAEVSVVRLHGAAVGADLGGSSKYTSEALVD